jgi:hypothetical protein
MLESKTMDANDTKVHKHDKRLDGMLIKALEASWSTRYLLFGRDTDTQ